MTGVVVRPMTEADIPAVVGIQEAIIRRPPGEHWVKMLGYHLSNQFDLSFVAELDGRPVGFVVGEIKIGPFGQEHSGWLEIVGVNPKLMGQGVGQALADALFGALSDRGVTNVFTAVEWDSGDMLAFFKSLGFDRSEYINLKKTLG